MDHHPQDGSQGRAQDAHRRDQATTASSDGSRLAAGRQPDAWSARWASWSGWSRTPGAGMFLLGAALAFGVSAASGQISSAVRSMRQADVIRVKGVGMAPVSADQAWWTGTVTARAGSLPEAFQKLDASTSTLRGFVVDQGIAPADIEVDSVRTSTENRRDAEGNLTNEIEVYTLRRSVTIWSKDVRLVERIAMRSTDLIREGHEVGSASPRYLVSTIESLKLELIDQGTANAREHANLLVDGSGGRLGRLVSAAQGAFDIVCAGSADFDGNGSYDTSCINKEARVVVTLEYAVE